MAKITSKQNTLLRDSRLKVSPKVYTLLMDLINNDREDLAEITLKVDYLISYANTALKAKDYKDALETVQRGEERLKIIKRDGYDTSHLDELIADIKKKIRK